MSKPFQSKPLFIFIKFDGDFALVGIFHDPLQENERAPDSLCVCVLTVSLTAPIGEINVQSLIPGLSGVLRVKSNQIKAATLAGRRGFYSTRNDRSNLQNLHQNKMIRQ